MLHQRPSALARTTLVLGLLVGGPAIAQDCVHFDAHLHPVGILTLADARDVALQGNHAIVANGSSGLYVVDISDPRRPSLLGSVDTPHQAWGVAVSGSHAYVADMDAGLRIVDISNPALPVLRGGIASSNAYDVAVSGSICYLAVAGAGVRVIDVTNATTPALLRTIDTPGSAYGVCVTEGRLYVADSWAGLDVYSLADPASPSYLGAFDTADSATKVCVEGPLAYVADFTGGLAILDVGNPAQITQVGIAPFAGYGARCVAVVGGTCLLGGDIGVQSLDVSAPAAPASRGHVVTGNEVLGMAASGTCAYAASGGTGLVIYDLADGTIANGLGASVATGGYATGVAVNTDHAFVSTQTVGFQVYGLTDPEHPSLVTTLPLPSWPGEIVLTGHTAAVACGPGGLQIVDVANPSIPSVIGSLVTTGRMAGLARLDDLLYAATGDSVRTIELSDPTTPRQLRAAHVTGDADRVAANEHGVFVGTLAGNIQWFTDSPAGLQWRTTAGLAAHNSGIAVQGEVVFAGYSEGPDFAGVAIFGLDLANHELDLLGDVRVPGYINSLRFDHHVLYLSCSSAGLVMVDVNDPSAPTIIGQALASPNDAFASASAGAQVYVADNTYGLAALPRECTTHVPVWLADFTAYSEANGVYLTWRVVGDEPDPSFRLTAAMDGLIWTVPCQTTDGGAWHARDAHPRLAAGGIVEYALSYDVGSGAWRELATTSVDLPAAAGARLLAVRPNPCNPRAVIPYVLDRDRTVRLAVFDLAARLVAVLAEGRQAAGAHEVVWDGRDQQGHQVASGLYYAKLTTEGGGTARKIMLVR